MPRFDSPACFAALLGDEQHGRWLLAPAGDADGDPPLPRGHARARDRVRDRRRALCVIDFMPPRQGAPTVIRIVEGRSGDVRCRLELLVRFDYGSIVPWVRRTDGRSSVHRRSRRAACCARRASRGQGPDHGATSRSEGERRLVLLTWIPSYERRPPPLDAARALEDRRSGGVTGWPPGAAEEMARRRPSLAHHAEGAHVRADRRHRRGTDHVAARADRRAPQLGLPVLLVARRHLHAARAARAGFVHEADAWNSWLPRAVAGSPDKCRSCTASRAIAASPRATSTGCRATRARRPFASATPPASSSSSTSTARPSTCC